MPTTGQQGPVPEFYFIKKYPINAFPTKKIKFTYYTKQVKSMKHQINQFIAIIITLPNHYFSITCKVLKKTIFRCVKLIYLPNGSLYGN